MLEASAEVLPKDTFNSAIAKGVKAATNIAEQIQKFRQECGKGKREAPERPTCSEEVIESMKR